MHTQKSRTDRRAMRVRSSVKTSLRPRLSVYRSNAHIWAQVIDDKTHTTICAINDIALKGTKTEKSKQVGQLIAKASIAAKCDTVVFDRGSYRYHGRVKSLADAARSAGLQF
jgi:large subunit ribosomal protein L18